MAEPLLERAPVRQAIQVAVGASLAITAGTLISGQRWYWALIAAFIVGIGAGSRGEAVIKGLQRFAGTLAGVLIGIALGTLLSGNALWSGGLALLFLFLAFYAFQAAYGTMIFFITLALALLYGLMGQFRPELLVLRLEETAAGAAIGMIAATLVLPIRQRDIFSEKLDGFLDAMAAVIGSACKDAAPSGPRDASRKPVEDLQRAMQELRQGVGALKRGWLPFVDKRYLFAIRAARRCGYLAREAVNGRGLPRATADDLTARIRRLRDSAGEPSRDKADGDRYDGDPLAEALSDALSRLEARLAALPAAQGSR